MKKAILLFPGQGAQFVGMAQDVFRFFPIAKETVQEADDLLGEFLSKTMFEGPEETLKETKNSQLAIFVASIALLRVLQKELGSLLSPIGCAGLSLGEYSALVASGRLSFEKGLFLVQKRAIAMNRACEEKKGAMAAVLGLSADLIEKVVQDVEGLWIANYNCPGQIVISGSVEGVEKGSALLKEKGAKRVLPLTVHGAFHSGLMQSAEQLFAPAIEQTKFSKGTLPIAMNVVGGFVDKEDLIKKALIAQVSGSVRWEQGILALNSMQPEVWLEIGCGRALTGFNKKIGVSGASFSFEISKDLESIATHLEGAVCC